MKHYVVAMHPDEGLMQIFGPYKTEEGGALAAQEDALDRIWDAINSHGGTFDPSDLEAKGCCEMIDKALEIIEKEGGVGAVQRRTIAPAEQQEMVDHAMSRYWQAYALRCAIRELGLRAFAQRDPKVREGIDLAIDHLKETLR